jgi:F-type H+-transporting ATPase subunit b
MRSALLRAAVVVFVAVATAGVAAPSSYASADADSAHGSHAAPHAPAVNWIDFDYKKTGSGPPLALALFNFAVLLFLLHKLFGKGLGQYLRERRAGIADALAESARLREEAQKKLDEYNQRIAGVEAEVQTLIAEIREQAQAEKARILAQAEAQAAAVKRDAENRIAAEIDRARRSLEREVVNAACDAAETLLRSNATEADQTRLVQEFIDTVANQAGSPQ